eukprot:3085402-Pleurochrysis_carterae.AAC.1
MAVEAGDGCYLQVGRGHAAGVAGLELWTNEQMEREGWVGMVLLVAVGVATSPARDVHARSYGRHTSRIGWSSWRISCLLYRDAPLSVFEMTAGFVRQQSFCHFSCHSHHCFDVMSDNLCRFCCVCPLCVVARALPVREVARHEHVEFLANMGRVPQGIANADFLQGTGLEARIDQETAKVRVRRTVSSAAGSDGGDGGG